MTALEPSLPRSGDPAGLPRGIAFDSEPGFPFRVQIPTVHMHHAVMSSLGFAEFTLTGIEHLPSGRTTAAWLLSDHSADWATSPHPWASTVRLSSDCWAPLTGDLDDPPTGPQPLRLTIPHHRVQVRPARVDDLLSGDEIGLHADDAARLGIGSWAFVNRDGVPAVLRVRTTLRAKDRGFTRMSFQTRLLLSVPSAPRGEYPEVLIGPPPTGTGGRPLHVAAPAPTPGRGRFRDLPRGVRARVGVLLDNALESLLRAPSITCRTLEATPGEDTLATVRLAAEVFPLLGTEPGKEVYLCWGPGNRTIATALAIDDGGTDQFTAPRIVGRRLDHLPAPPAFARVQIGAASRATLGIPRATVVTIRRRVLPLILVRLNELIVPVTALCIAFAADLDLTAWQLGLASLLVMALLIAPLRVRQPPRGRVPR